MKYLKMGWMPSTRSIAAAAFLLFSFCNLQAQHGEKWLEYSGNNGPGKGKTIVLISGDDEYRSEEGMPMMAKILSTHHGFDTKVLFSIDPEKNEIVPNHKSNIPGLHFLEEADLVIMLIRFRELPDEQMRYIDDYVQSGKPIIGLRTSTHAFNYGKDNNSKYKKYHWMSNEPGWEKGFGKKILGETWVAHHGHHAVEGARAIIDGLAVKHPILRGVKDIWVASDVYTVNGVGADAEVLLQGATTKGMTADTPILWEKALMPIAWTQTYTADSGNSGKVFTTTMGASVDLETADLRKLIVNAAYWCLNMSDKITENTNVAYVGAYNPTMYGFDNWRRGMKVADFK